MISDHFDWGVFTLVNVAHICFAIVLIIIIRYYDCMQKERNQKNYNDSIVIICNQMRAIVRGLYDYENNVTKNNKDDDTHIIHLINYLKTNNDILHDHYTNLLTNIKFLNTQNENYKCNLNDAAENIHWLLFDYFSKLLVIQNVDRDNIVELSDDLFHNCTRFVDYVKEINGFKSEKKCGVF